MQLGDVTTLQIGDIIMVKNITHDGYIIGPVTDLEKDDATGETLVYVNHRHIHIGKMFIVLDHAHNEVAIRFKSES